MAEKPRCKAIKRGGGRCSNTALDSSEYCWSHSKETAEQRRAYAAAGGRARSRRPPDELEKIKGQLRAIAAAVLQGTVDKGTAAVLGQLYNTLLRSIELQSRLVHQQELVDQVAELRGRLEELKRLRYGSA